MKPQKRTPKKKSAPSSQTSKTRRKPAAKSIKIPVGALPIYSTTAGMLTGRVVGETPDSVVLEWAANLELGVEAVNGGQSFIVKARLTAPLLVGEVYFLNKSAIRGTAYRNDSWLVDLYARFAVRADRGEFELNPYAPPETTSIVQGDGAVSAEEGTVATLQPEVASNG